MTTPVGPSVTELCLRLVSMDTDDPNQIADTLRRAAAGDQEAWQAIVKAFSPRVFGLIRTQCGDPDLAEEIVQSAFCTVAQKIEGYEEYGRFDAWVFRIAMNRLRDEMRRRKRQARPMEEKTLVALGGSDPPREPGIEPAAQLALQNALSKLSEADRQVIDLRHVGGMSFRQIGELLEEPVGTLLARHHRALKKLRALLEEDKNSGKDAD